MFLNLKPHESFLEINSDPDVAASLEALYSHPDNVELYPGVSVEDTKPPMVPGSGLCSGLTITRAILADAVALVRGDRLVELHLIPTLMTDVILGSIRSTAAQRISLHSGLPKLPPT